MIKTALSGLVIGSMTLVIGAFLHNASLWPFREHNLVTPKASPSLQPDVSTQSSEVPKDRTERGASVTTEKEEHLEQALSIGGDFKEITSSGEGVLFIGHAYGNIENNSVPYRPLEFMLDRYLSENKEITKLVFLGDMTQRPKFFPEFLSWVSRYPQEKIYVAGNHDGNMMLFTHVPETSAFSIGSIKVKTINFVDQGELILHEPEKIFAEPFDICISHYGFFHPLLPVHLWKDPYEDYVNSYQDLSSVYKSGERTESKAEWGRDHYETFGKKEGRTLYDPNIEKGFNNLAGMPLEYLTHKFHNIYALKDRVFISGDCGAGVRESKPFIFEVVDRKILLCTGMGNGPGDDNLIVFDKQGMRFVFFDGRGEIQDERVIFCLTCN